MKRFFALFTIIALILLTIPALAEFNSDVFKEIDNVSVNIDDMEGAGYIDLDSLKPCFFDPNYSEYKYCAFYPSVRVNNTGVGVLRLFGSFWGRKWALIDTMIIKIGDNRYTFSDVHSERDTGDHEEINEELAIVMDSTTEVFVKDFIEHSDGEIKVRWKGEKYNVDFVMTDSMKATFKVFFEKYIEAGGYNPDNITVVTINSHMTIR